MLLDNIIADKALEVKTIKEQFKFITLKNIEEIFPPIKDFTSEISKPGKINLIAELKKKSPSAGEIISNFKPAEIAKIYEEAGASAISLLTDWKYFEGILGYLKAVKQAVKLPILRKDFIIDEIQIYESRMAGADAVLLIARILDSSKLKQFIELCDKIKLPALVEVHNEAETEKALKAGAQIIGINNRDLDTLKVDFNISLQIINKFPELKNKILVSESGINSPSQIKELKSAGFNAVLIGEALLKSPDIKEKTKELLSK
ncbi:MAG: indole-3-glycerol phosphate synthase [Candidatus Saganbacteria bacterium]|uniref:Indole-3-glycerol phosphate synthase n=1 Tax=Candidatus Saganbacteria bacterium TaxID=2575572 RepID=A0A833L042_UNCSA|nr:MAG: indole-3-glycerol phosphate synthase [Candidatus Saganbacteria bacterium]